MKWFKYLWGKKIVHQSWWHYLVHRPKWRLMNYIHFVVGQPEAKYCGECGKRNYNFDDCGSWFWNGKHLCEVCMPWEEHHGDR
jgi:hypothetical protein